MVITNNYVIQVKALNIFKNTSFSQVQKSVRKITIFYSFEGFGPPRNQNFKPPSAMAVFFLNLVPGHNYGVFRYLMILL